MAFYKDLREYEYRTALRKSDIADRLGVTRPRYSRIRDPRAGAHLTEAEVSAISSLLCRSERYVRRMYVTAASCRER